MQNEGFKFFNNYVSRIYNLQEELYLEEKRIIDIQLQSFIENQARKPLVLDVGGGGLLPYDTNLSEKVVILDLFPKPDNVTLPGNTEWVVGDVLSTGLQNILPHKNYDIIIMESLLHHLCDENNNIINNVSRCFENTKKLLSLHGQIFICESTCPYLLTKIEDMLYFLYSWILRKIFRFTYVRMLSVRELIAVLKLHDFNINIITFRRPKYIAQMFWRVRLKYYPLAITFICANMPKQHSKQHSAMYR